MKNIKVPHTFTIIFFVVFFCAILTYVIPMGQYDVQEITYEQNGQEKTKTVLDADSFRLVTDENGEVCKYNAPLFGTDDVGGKIGLLNYMFEGLVSGDKGGAAVGIVAFILVVGGAFGVMFRTGAIENAIFATISKTQNKEILIIPILFTLFSAGGAIFGMSEEAIPFAMIVVPVVVMMGYDAVVGIMITYGATQIGFATSWMNPFSVAVAQGISGVPVMSGSGLRIFMWLFFTIFGVAFTMLYATKIKKNPQKSISYTSDEYFRKDAENKDVSSIRLKTGDILVIVTLFTTIVWVIWGVIRHGYYIPEITSQFFIMGLVSGIIGVVFKMNEMTTDDIAKSFQKGAADLLGAALVVGMAKGILIILGGADPSIPSVLNTILDSASRAIGNLPTALSAWFMYVFQSIFNFFVVSGSGQAALTMPLMAPLSDLVGVTRQVAVLAFQLGDGFSNLIVPTSGALIGCLGAARLDFGKWIKFSIKLQAWLFAFASIFMIAAVMIGYK